MFRPSLPALAFAACLLCGAPARAAVDAAPASPAAAPRYGEGNLMFSATAQSAYQVTLWKIAYRSTGSDVLAQAGVWADAHVAQPARTSPWATAVDWLGALRSEDADGGAASLDPAAAPPAVVPEPSSYAALLVGLLAIGVVSRCRAASARA